MPMRPIEVCPATNRDRIPTDPLSRVELEALLRIAAATEASDTGPPRRETVELSPLAPTRECEPVRRVRRGTRRSREILRVQDIRPIDPANDPDDSGAVS